MTGEARVRLSQKRRCEQRREAAGGKEIDCRIGRCYTARVGPRAKEYRGPLDAGKGMGMDSRP